MPTILIVDDPPANREFLVTLLGYGGHRLLEAADGAEALATARAVRPDLIITAILMPTMDGYEFVRQLRADPAIARVPVIFCTAHYHEQEARNLANACAVSHLLMKPCEPEEVLRTVEAALGNERPLAAAPAPEEFEREHLRVLTDKLSQKADELRRTNERLTALVELGLQLGSERDPPHLLNLFCNSVREIIGARYAVAGIVDDRSSLRFFCPSGMDAATLDRFRAPDPSHGGIASVLTECRCLRLRNPGGDPTALGFAPTYPPVHSWLGAPIQSPAKVYGWLSVIDKLGADEFSAEDERLAGLLAAQVGHVYENGSLYADLLAHTAELNLEIAERKRAEEALRREREFFRQVLDTDPNLIFVKDAAGRFVLANKAMGQLYGMSPEELVDRQPEDDLPLPREFAEYRRVDQEVLRTGRPIELDETNTRPDGSMRWFHTIKVPLLMPDGATHVLAVVADITDRKRAEEAVRQAQQRLRHVISSSPAVLYTLAVHGERIQGIAWTSDNIQEILGYPAAEALGSNWFTENMHPEDRDWLVDTLRQELFAHDHVANEYRFRHRDGKYRWLHSEMRLLRDAVNNPVEIVGSWSDITERRVLEDQFRQSQKMEAVGRLAGGVAHDFNNLLTVITGYSELLLAQLRVSDPMHAQLDQIRQAGERAARLTRQLLAFSRKQLLVPVALDLNALLKEMEKMLGRLIGEDIDLMISPHAPLWPVKADPGQMEQVVMNLVVNSRDAMQGGGKLTIETDNVELDDSYVSRHPEVRPGAYVKLAVSDTGCGMDAATLARIFEPFFSTKGERGTGLGLATVYGIVKQSGGSLDVYSEPGVGTSFKIYLPRDRAARAERKSSPDLKLTARGTETLLLVEDEPGVRSLATLVLQTDGYTVLEAKHGGEALLLCEQFRGKIHMLVTDVIMPQMSGPQLAERLSIVRPNLKVLYLSGYTDDAIVHHGVLNPDTPFLQKPFSPTALARKVREVLDR